MGKDHTLLGKKEWGQMRRRVMNYSPKRVLSHFSYEVIRLLT